MLASLALVVQVGLLVGPSSPSPTYPVTFARYSQPRALDTMASPQEEEEEELETYPGSGYTAARNTRQPYRHLQARQQAQDRWGYTLSRCILHLLTHAFWDKTADIY